MSTRIHTLIGIVIASVVLIAPAKLLGHQEPLPTATNARPIVTRASLQRPIAVEPSEPARTIVEGDWSDVMGLEPGREIVVTTNGAPPVKRLFVTADAVTLTVLDHLSPDVPSSVSHLLTSWTSRRPEQVAGTLLGTDAALGENAHIGPQGLFVDDVKLANLNQIVTRLARKDIVEIGPPTVKRGLRAAGISLIAGGLILGAVWLDIAHSTTEIRYPNQTVYHTSSNCCVGEALINFGVAATGAGMVEYAASHKHMIYRAVRRE